MRQSKMDNYMEMAITAAKRSHDTETQVGAILVKNISGAIIATGFNGFVRNAPDNLLPNSRPEKYEYILHAEENVIYNCARHGISMDDCTLVCTLSPCKACMRKLYNCGITKVVIKDFYKDFEEVQGMKDIDITIDRKELEPFITLKYQHN